MCWLSLSGFVGSWGEGFGDASVGDCYSHCDVVMVEGRYQRVVCVCVFPEDAYADCCGCLVLGVVWFPVDCLGLCVFPDDYG